MATGYLEYANISDVLVKCHENYAECSKKNCMKKIAQEIPSYHMKIINNLKY